MDYLSDPRPGDFLILRPPPSKADPWDAIWGANPIYLPLAPSTLSPLLCPFRAVAAQYIAGDLVAGTPCALITENNGTPLSSDRADRILAALLTAACPLFKGKLSWHSMRIFLACCLLASNASPAQIQAIYMETLHKQSIPPLTILVTLHKQKSK